MKTVRVLTEDNYLLQKDQVCRIREESRDGTVIIDHPLFPNVRPTLLKGEYVLVKCFVLNDDTDCFHKSCRLKRGEITKQEYLEDLVRYHFDENWGRFLDEEKRAKYHSLLVKDAIERNLTDDNGLPDFDIISAVWIGILGDKT